MLLACPAVGAVTLADLQRQIDARHFTDAARQSQIYLDIHPGNRDARFIRARALAGQGHVEEAIAAFESLASDYPLRPEPANNLAVLYAHTGAFDEARRWLDTALATQPAYATVHRNLGDIYTALADLAYKRALGGVDTARRVPLTMLDRLYYAQESVAPGNPRAPAPTPAKPESRPAPAAGSNKRAAHASVGIPLAAVWEPPLGPSDNSRGIMQTVRAWALAWSSQDVDAYTDFYADDFDPGDGMSRSQWLALRRARLGQPDQIHIRIENPTIEQRSSGRAQVDFEQHYDSPRYSDRVTKRLILIRQDTGWRIVRESSIVHRP